MSITQISPHKTAALGSQRRFEEMNRDVIRIQAPCGDLIGFRSQPTGLIELLGIPYAEPPIGGRRFRPPCAKVPFEEPFEALKFGPASAQVFDAKEASTEEYGESFERQPIFVGSEDSLSLNVWTPGCDELARPVHRRQSDRAGPSHWRQRHRGRWCCLSFFWAVLRAETEDDSR